MSTQQQRPPETSANLTGLALLCFGLALWILPWLAERASPLDWMDGTSLRVWILVAGVGILVYEVGRRLAAAWSAARRWTPSAVMMVVALVLVVWVGIWSLQTVLDGAG